MYPSVIHFHSIYIYIDFIVCKQLLYCCPLCQPLDVMLMVNVIMITNNPNQSITNCVMQGLSKICRSRNGTLTLLSSLPPCLPAGNLVQRSVERVSLVRIPLDFVCEALEFFGHVKELECENLMNPQEVCCVLFGNHMSTAQFADWSLEENR